MADIALSNVINVSLTGIPSGLSERNVNNLAFFTVDLPDNVDMYRDYYSSREVAEDYGTDSSAYEMANAIFAQNPNIMSGNGVLRIIPYLNAESATQGKFVTADISANLAALVAVTNGDLRIVIDSVNVDLTGMDFSNATTLTEIASIIQGYVQNAKITADESTDKITFLSKTYGTDSTVTLAAVPGGTGTSLIAAGYLNSAAGVATAGADSTGETLEEAIVRTEQSVAYCGIVTDLRMEDAIIEDLSDTVQSRDMILILPFSSTEQLVETTGIVSLVQLATNTHTRCIFYSEPDEAVFCTAAYAGRGFSVNFSGTATSQTMNLKALATIVPDSSVNQTIYNTCETVGADMYVSYSGVPCVVSNGANLYFDQIYSRLALKFALEAGMFNYLRQTNTKVPQTESGMIGLKNSAIIQLNRFVVNGYIGVGLVWNSSETFGNPVIFRNNITENGYYVYSIPIAQQIQSEREQRIAPLIQIAIKESSAIHSVDVIVVCEA